MNEPFSLSFQLLLSNLTSKALYRVSIRGATVSLYNPNRIYQGPETPVQQIHLRDNCDQVQAFTVLEDKDNSPVLDLGTGAIAVGAALAGMALILGAAALVMKRSAEDTQRQEHNLSCMDWTSLKVLMFRYQTGALSVGFEDQEGHSLSTSMSYEARISQCTQ